ncbi:hypothetical protein RHGRI_005268 [Rhododendron griersonianum]|uniref:Vacuolar protein sorting-associated protein 52 A n=1 Tax=Rhododendron griersonianum TaxID=479676 RepID=A0AAV6LEU1_9ERIC|nr:hypothetical protein RHGRI_005268 [Rhododendron griersonianum]
MAEVTTNKLVHSFDVTNDVQKSLFDLGAFVGDLSVEEDTNNDDISLEGLEQELDDCKDDDDYINESDNLVSLHDQIRDCDNILSQMETLLGGFQAFVRVGFATSRCLLWVPSLLRTEVEQALGFVFWWLRLCGLDGFAGGDGLAGLVGGLEAEIGSISSDIKVLQEKSMDMGLKLKNRKVAESRLAKFVEDIIVPPRMIDIIVDGEVNDEFMRTLEIMSKKLKFVEVDPMVKTSVALKDVLPELERLRQKAVSKCLAFLRSILSSWYIISFLKEHGKDVYTEVHAAYVDTMNKVLSAHFRAYIQALEKLQLDIATSSDLIGVDTRSSGLFSRGREPLKNRYLFCDDFFGEESIFYEIFAGPFAVIDEHFNTILPNCFDAIGLMLMIRIIHQHQVNISLWPRFKMVFDMHLSSLRNANVKALWEDDVHPHYVMRRYAEFTASLIHLNVEFGHGQIELNLERLRMAANDLLVKLAKMFPKPKLQTVFLINNYDMTIAVLKEAGPEGGKIQLHFEELLKNNTAIFVVYAAFVAKNDELDLEFGEEQESNGTAEDSDGNPNALDDRSDAADDASDSANSGDGSDGRDEVGSDGGDEVGDDAFEVFNRVDSD